MINQMLYMFRALPVYWELLILLVCMLIPNYWWRLAFVLTSIGFLVYSAAASENEMAALFGEPPLSVAGMVLLALGCTAVVMLIAWPGTVRWGISSPDPIARWLSRAASNRDNLTVAAYFAVGIATAIFAAHAGMLHHSNALAYWVGTALRVAFWPAFWASRMWELIGGY